MGGKCGCIRRGIQRGFFPGLSNNCLLLCIGLHPAKSSYIPALQKCLQWERLRRIFVSQVGATCKFGQLKHLISSVTSLAMLLRPSLSTAMSSFQSLKIIHQDYCMLNQLNLFLYLFHLTSELKVILHCHNTILPSFEVDFLSLVLVLKLGSEWVAIKRMFSFSSRCIVKITGDMTVSFPSGIIKVFTSNPSPAVLCFRVKNTSKLEQILPNAQLVYRFCIFF